MGESRSSSPPHTFLFRIRANEPDQKVILAEQTFKHETIIAMTV